MRYTQTVILTIAALLIAHTAYAQQQQQQAARVVVSTVTSKEIDPTTAAIGMLYFDRVSSLSTEVAGMVKRVLIREGDRVERGQPLFELDTDFVETDIEIQKANIEQLAVQIAQTAKNLKRYEDLYKSSAASEKQYDDLFFEYRELIKQKKSMEKQLDRAILKKTKSTIRAPFDGIVLEKNADTGDWIVNGGVLCRIGSTADFYARVPVAEQLLRFVRTGAAVSVTLNAFDREIPGTIAAMDPIADEKTKNVFLKIKIPFQPEAVENMSATAYIPSGLSRKATVVPRDALVRHREGHFVFTIKEKKAQMIPVSVDSYSGAYAVIDSSDIPQGVPVVIDGNERLRPDQPVEIVEKL